MKSEANAFNQSRLVEHAAGRLVAGVTVVGFDEIPTDVLVAFQAGNVVVGHDEKTGKDVLIWGRRLLSLIASGKAAVPVLMQFVPVDLKRHDVERLTKACAVIKGLDWREEMA